MKKVLKIIIALTLILPKIAVAPLFQWTEMPERIIISGNTFQGIIQPEVTSMGWREVTAYSSSPDECWGDPFETASGQRTRHGIVASNELPFGTWIRIEGVGDFEVQDRMNQRYAYRVDIWMPSKQEALEFGRQVLKIEKISYF